SHRRTRGAEELGGRGGVCREIETNDTEKSLTVFEIDFGFGRNQRRNEARIDDVIQHRQITPAGREKWLHATNVNAQSGARDSGSQNVPDLEWESGRRVRSRRSIRTTPRLACEVQAADFSAQQIVTQPARYRSKRAATESYCA